jgi:putrescine transport system substrate-binding protein
VRYVSQCNTNLDPALMSKVAEMDSGNAHSVILTWGTFGLGFNQATVAKALPGVAPDSWGLIFDPTNAKRLASCGINVTDDPSTFVRLVLMYMGKSATAPNLQDIAEVEGVLAKIRPYIRNINTTFNFSALAQGEGR